MCGMKPGTNPKRKQLKRICMIYATMAKMFIFVSEAETRVKSPKQVKISTNGLFQSDLCNGGPFPGRFRLKTYVSYNLLQGIQPFHSRQKKNFCCAGLAYFTPRKNFQIAVTP